MRLLELLGLARPKPDRPIEAGEAALRKELEVWRDGEDGSEGLRRKKHRREEEEKRREREGRKDTPVEVVVGLLVVRLSQWEPVLLLVAVAADRT